MRACRWLGIVCQAIVLGLLLFFAVGNLIALGTGARVFIYEAF